MSRSTGPYPFDIDDHARSLRNTSANGPRTGGLDDVVVGLNVVVVDGLDDVVVVDGSDVVVVDGSDVVVGSVVVVDVGSDVVVGRTSSWSPGRTSSSVGSLDVVVVGLDVVVVVLDVVVVGRRRRRGGRHQPRVGPIGVVARAAVTRVGDLERELGRAGNAHRHRLGRARRVMFALSKRLTPSTSTSNTTVPALPHRSSTPTFARNDR